MSALQVCKECAEFIPRNARERSRRAKGNNGDKCSECGHEFRKGELIEIISLENQKGE